MSKIGPMYSQPSSLRLSLVSLAASDGQWPPLLTWNFQVIASKGSRWRAAIQAELNQVPKKILHVVPAQLAAQQLFICVPCPTVTLSLFQFCLIECWNLYMRWMAWHYFLAFSACYVHTLRTISWWYPDFQNTVTVTVTLVKFGQIGGFPNFICPYPHQNQVNMVDAQEDRP